MYMCMYAHHVDEMGWIIICVLFIIIIHIHSCTYIIIIIIFLLYKYYYILLSLLLQCINYTLWVSQVCHINGTCSSVNPGAYVGLHHVDEIN